MTLQLSGAVGAEGVDQGVAAHYGNPYGEQRAPTESVGFVDRSNRGVLRVWGADRLSWLHSLTTQQLTDLPAWRGTQALVLSPHGHIEHHLVVADDGESTWLDVEPATAAALAGYLDSMRFMLRVEVADVSADWAVLSLVGPAVDEAIGALGPLGADLGGQPYDVAPLTAGGFVRRMPGPDPAADVLLRRADLMPVAQRLRAAGGRAVGVLAAEALRVAARRPRLGWETDHRTIVQEGGWLETAVHLDKGCYRGQETVARVHNLGRPPRRMVLLHLDGAAETLPPHGAVISLDERPVGFIGTAARHFELGPIALAIIRRNTPDGAALRIDEVDASIDAA